MAAKKLTWPLKSYKPDAIRELLRIVESNMENFDVLRAAERSALADDLRILNAGFGTNITMAQAVSVRNLVSITRNIISSRHAPNLTQYFQTYLDLHDSNHVEIVRRASRIYNMPPLFILRAYAAFQFPDVAPKLILSGKVASDLAPAIAWANEHDAESIPNKAQSQREGELYERMLERHLDKAGIAYRNQADVSAEQIKASGSAYATPDILFVEPIDLRVGDRTIRINWMDAKHFMYVPLVPNREHLNRIETDRYMPSYIDTKLAEQAERYQRHFGPGAFVFAFGYMKSSGPSGFYSRHLNIPNVECVLLSGEHILEV